MTIEKLAIVNRGEAAIRALTAVEELNQQTDRPKITTVALYTEPDADAWFVRRADEAVCLGAASYTDPSGNRKATYLDEDRVVSAMVKAGADAAWVGWGLLSERASFAEACTTAGITFVGPDDATIRVLGDKMAAKKLAERAGVPVIPWSGGPVTDIDSVIEWGARLGYPVMLKAAAGGGGRGIRMVTEEAGMAAALASARTEAELAFGDPTVFCEKAIPAARHIEVQVVADSWGTTWAVGCRDCSVQRHNQKVIEESAILDDEKGIRDAAIRIAREAGYRGAGTVEFLSDPGSGQSWFMEVNPRLQVEHPVTEATSGVDLVKLQLQIAEGGRLPDREPAHRGHAIEARLCAEDPEQGFAPAPGRIAVWRPPTGPGIRVDSGVTEGDRVPAEFDSMIAKVVAWGDDREEALCRLRRALTATVVVIEGGATNRTFLLGLLRQPELTAGPVHNRWLDGLVAADSLLPRWDPLAVALAAIESYDCGHAEDVAAYHEPALRGRPRLSRGAGRQVSLSYRENRYRVSVFRTGPDTYLVDGGREVAELRVTHRDGPQRQVSCAGRVHRCTVAPGTMSFTIDIDDEASHRVYVDDDDDVIRARFPAFVIAVLAAEGDQLAAGDAVILLESMKMETAVTAAVSGTVTGLHVRVGTQVVLGDPMVTICGTSAPSGPVSALTGLPAAGKTHDVYAALSSYLLGFDVAGGAVEPHLAAQRELGARGPTDDPALFTAEREFLALFADISALCWLHPEVAGQLTAGTPQLFPDQPELPDDLREPLRAVLARYVATSQRSRPGLDEAALWMSRAVGRAGELAPVVTVILRRWLRHRNEFGHSGVLQELVDRLVVTTRSHRPAVSELARDVRFRIFDEPAYQRLAAHLYANANCQLDELESNPGRADRGEAIGQLVQCPQPMRGLLLRRWRTADPPLRAAILEVYMRRYYRRRTLQSIEVVSVGGQRAGTADYSEDGRPCRLLVTYLPFRMLPTFMEAVAGYLAGHGEPAATTVEIVTWRPGSKPDAEALAGEVGALLAACPSGPPGPEGQQLRRVDLTQ